MRILALMSVTLMALFCAPVPVLAHHSFAAEYDANKQINVTGTVTKVEWMNPHARFYVDVKEGDSVVNWNFELGPINLLVRAGWRRDSLKVGEMVSVVGYAAKDSSHSANARTVTLSDGRRVFAGSSAGDAGAKKE
jgi:Family of unknown function (DUF6152)